MLKNDHGQIQITIGYMSTSDLIKAIFATQGLSFHSPPQKHLADYTT